MGLSMASVELGYYWKGSAMCFVGLRLCTALIYHLMADDVCIRVLLSHPGLVMTESPKKPKWLKSGHQPGAYFGHLAKSSEVFWKTFSEHIFYSNPGHF